MQKKYQLILIALIGFTSFMNAQTIGLLQNTENSFNGYTLLDGTIAQRAFLIDNCGEKVNEWTFPNRPGLMSYFTIEGNLLRAEKIDGAFGGGGVGGRVVLYDWDSNPLWIQNFSSDTYQQHHDIEILPNGNFLIVLWVKHTAEEAIAQGRNPQLLNGELWSTRIQEIEILENNQSKVVWEWNLWDHLVQDFDADKPNYGNVSESPSKLDLNYKGASNLPLGNAVDWIHMNAISYNEDLDQIVVSSRHLSEVWIIDHSTTTEEAKTNSGGNANMGGDIIYRWGNPEIYDRGELEDQVLFGQHDVQWAKIGAEQSRGLLLFNNGAGRPGVDFSQIDFLKLPLNGSFNYKLNGDLPYGPDTTALTINKLGQDFFYSSSVSGVQMQPNGNMLVTVGDQGLLVEIDTATNEDYWKYIYPVFGNNVVIQGSIPYNNFLFKVRRYPSDFSGFEGKNLQPQGPVELNPWPSDCNIFSGTRDPKSLNNDLVVFPNPASQTIFISSPISDLKKYSISNVMGNTINQGKLSDDYQIDVSQLSSGIYFLNIPGHTAQKFVIAQ